MREMRDDAKDEHQHQSDEIPTSLLAPALDISSPAILSNASRSRDSREKSPWSGRVPDPVQDSPDTVMYERTVNSIYESYARVAAGISCSHESDEKVSGLQTSSAILVNHLSLPMTPNSRTTNDLSSIANLAPSSQIQAPESSSSDLHHTLSKCSFASDTGPLQRTEPLLSIDPSRDAPSQAVDKTYLPGNRLETGGIQQRVPLHRQGTDDGIGHVTTNYQRNTTLQGMPYTSDKIANHSVEYAGDAKDVNGSGMEIDTKSLGGDFPPLGASHQKARQPRKRSVWAKCFPGSKYTRWFLFLVIVETLINIGIEANLLFRFNHALDSGTATSIVTLNKVRLPVYLSIFAMAHLFQLVLAFDAAIFRNTIQIIGLSIFNGLFLVYAVIQMDEIKDILGTAEDGSRITGETPYSVLHIPVTVQTAIILGVIAAAEVGFVILSWFIYKDFGWETYKDLGANLKIKRYYLHHQIFVCLIRFASFFFVGFGVQFIFLILPKSDPEYYVTIAALPASVLSLVAGAFGAGYEAMWAMGGFMIGMLVGLGYFVFKTYRLYNQRDIYYQVYKSLTVFSGLSMLILVVSLIWAGIVMSNFRKGLRQQRIRAKLRKGKGRRNKQKGLATELDGQADGNHAMETVKRRMTLD